LGRKTFRKKTGKHPSNHVKGGLKRDRAAKEGGRGRRGEGLFSVGRGREEEG